MFLKKTPNNNKQNTKRRNKRKRGKGDSTLYSPNQSYILFFQTSTYAFHFMSLALGFEEPRISNSDDPIFPMPKRQDCSLVSIECKTNKQNTLKKYILIYKKNTKQLKNGLRSRKARLIWTHK